MRRLVVFRSMRSPGLESRANINTLTTFWALCSMKNSKPGGYDIKQLQRDSFSLCNTRVLCRRHPTDPLPLGFVCIVPRLCHLLTRDKSNSLSGRPLAVWKQEKCNRMPKDLEYETHFPFQVP